MHSLDDTIAALATAPGEGGVAIVRVSGPHAAAVAAALLRTASGDPPLLSPRVATLCRAVRPGEGVLLDEVLALWMPAPRSYTREDVLEIHGHGGQAAARAVLDAALALGARLARPGEFTLRAYLRGRIDLVQAEAVADVIRARTARSLAVHEALLGGALSREVARWQEALGAALAPIEASLDFPEDDLPDADRGALLDSLRAVSEGMAEKLRTYAWGRTAREGYRVAILGAPNVGKSSLLNRLAEEERAIVSPVPGTTRDTVEVSIDALGAPVRVVDTAGLRESACPVEGEGVRRARSAARDADLLLLVFDATRPPAPEEVEDARALACRTPALWLLNKCDAPGFDPAPYEGLSDASLLPVSAATGEGIEALLALLRDRAWSGGEPRGEDALTRLRHREAVAAAREALERALVLLANPAGALDAAACELQEARRSLASLLGWGTPEEVLERIFSDFCIGK